jgi:S-adenosylmethionine decarboxylase
MEPTGQHLILDFWGCDRAALDDVVLIEEALVEAARVADAHIVKRVMHAFQPHGVTGMLLLEESHLSIHTWPESGYAAIDFYTCAAGDPARAERALIERLHPTHVERQSIPRGVRPSIARGVR